MHTQFFFVVLGVQRSSFKITIIVRHKFVLLCVVLCGRKSIKQTFILENVYFFMTNMNLLTRPPFARPFPIMLIFRPIMLIFRPIMLFFCAPFLIDYASEKY